MAKRDKETKNKQTAAVSSEVVESVQIGEMPVEVLPNLFVAYKDLTVFFPLHENVDAIFADMAERDIFFEEGLSSIEKITRVIAILDKKAPITFISFDSAHRNLDSLLVKKTADICGTIVEIVRRYVPSFNEIKFSWEETADQRYQAVYVYSQHRETGKKTAHFMIEQEILDNIASVESIGDFVATRQDFKGRLVWKKAQQGKSQEQRIEFKTEEQWLNDLMKLLAPLEKYDLRVTEYNAETGAFKVNCLDPKNLDQLFNAKVAAVLEFKPAHTEQPARPAQKANPEQNTHSNEHYFNKSEYQALRNAGINVSQAKIEHQRNGGSIEELIAKLGKK